MLHVFYLINEVEELKIVEIVKIILVESYEPRDVERIWEHQISFCPKTIIWHLVTDFS